MKEKDLLKIKQELLRKIAVIDEALKIAQENTPTSTPLQYSNTSQQNIQTKKTGNRSGKGVLEKNESIVVNAVRATNKSQGFSFFDIENALKGTENELNGGAIRSAINRLLNENKFALVQQGAGRSPSIYKEVKQLPWETNTSSNKQKGETPVNPFDDEIPF